MEALQQKYVKVIGGLFKVLEVESTRIFNEAAFHIFEREPLIFPFLMMEEKLSVSVNLVPQNVVKRT